MKKSISILMALLMMGSVCFTSCNKEDDIKSDPTPEPIKETPVDVNFVVAIVENQLKFIEQFFEFDVNGMTVNFSVSQMNKVSNKSKYPDMEREVEKALIMMNGTKGKQNYDYYDYKLGSLTPGQSVTAKKFTCKILESRPVKDTLNYLHCWDVCNVSADTPKTLLQFKEVALHKDIKTDADTLDLFFNKLIAKKFSFTATVK